MLNANHDPPRSVAPSAEVTYWIRTGFYPLLDQRQTKGGPKADKNLPKADQNPDQRQTKGRPKADQRKTKGRAKAKQRESKGPPKAEQTQTKS